MCEKSVDLRAMALQAITAYMYEVWKLKTTSQFPIEFRRLFADILIESYERAIKSEGEDFSLGDHDYLEMMSALEAAKQDICKLLSS